MRDIITEIWATARRNKLRTALTGFAVAWGIFMLIFLLGAGNGVLNAQIANNDRFMVNSMIVYGGYTSKAAHGMNTNRSITLQEFDRNFVATQYPKNVDEVGALLQRSSTVSYGSEYFVGTIIGTYPNHQAINKIEMLYGRFINDIDIRERRKVAVISKSKAQVLQKDYKSLIGKYVNVDKLALKIVGIAKDDGNDKNNNLFIPFSAFKLMYNIGDDVGQLEFTFHDLETEESNEQFENNIRSRVNNYKQAALSDENTLYFWNRFIDNQNMNKAISMLHNALWIVGLLTLLSGIVGISNIMLITVKERTREFGIRKAIGATPWLILRLIIIESIVITTLFGYVGMVLGVVANEIMDATLGHHVFDVGPAKANMFLNPTVGLDVCIEATVVMIIAGTIAGLIPAYKAARIRPIEALRAE